MINTTKLSVEACQLQRFLSSQLGVQTHPHPPARVGVRLDAHPSIAELVDASGLVPVAGSSASPSFQHYLIAELAAQPPEEVAIDVLRVWCDDALRVEGYDDQLARLLSSATVAHGNDEGATASNAAGSSNPRPSPRRSRQR